MRSITRLFSAFTTLADSVLALASVVDMATARLRLTLADDYAQLGHEPPAAEIVDSCTNGAIPAEQTTAKRCRKAAV